MRTSETGEDQVRRVRVKHLGKPSLWVWKVIDGVYPQQKEMKRPYQYTAETVDMFEEVEP